MVDGQCVGFVIAFNALKLVSGHDFQAHLLPLRMLEFFGVGHDSKENPHQAQGRRSQEGAANACDGGDKICHAFGWFDAHLLQLTSMGTLYRLAWSMSTA